MTGVVPAWLLNGLALSTVYAVMFGLGLGIGLGALRAAVWQPLTIGRSLLCALVAVPVVAVITTAALGLSRQATIGIVLMAIAPGAPLALRRAVDAGAERHFATVLQVGLAVLAVVSMPLWVAALNRWYEGHASLPPGQVARQVFVVQLLPLALGIAVRHVAERFARSVQPMVERLAFVLLLALLAAAVLEAWDPTMRAGPRVGAAIVLVTLAALALGHWAGGRAASARTTVAIDSALRNPGLALLVAALNHAGPEVTSTVLAYIVLSMLTTLPYVMWRRRAKSRPP